MPPQKKAPYSPPVCNNPLLTSALSDHAERCIECKLCVKECGFLAKYGTPKQIALGYDPSSRQGQGLPFACSLCNLCETVCPAKIGLNPAGMFLEMRRESVSRGAGDFAEHGVILGYEQKGTSKRYSYYGLPAGCDAVFFPGCTLPGTRPDKVMALFDHLRKSVASLGIVLDCCGKPSHDLGRDNHFHAMFNEMKNFLTNNGVRQVLVACPSCYRVFKEYGGEIAVRSVYEHMAENGLPATPAVRAQVTVHDPCSTRYEDGIQQAVRKLAGEKSLHIEEMKHHGRKTMCCGEGGSAGFLVPDLAKDWGLRRKNEVRGKTILTYCAGCAGFLNPVTPTRHIVDLLFEPEKTMAGKVKVAKAPFTYLNRIRLKSRFKKKIKARVARERTFTGEKANKNSLLLICGKIFSAVLPWKR
ncbi:MAG: (Fe-S)-binding protein [Deltaproteobacteria bacterium]|nr:(Fe-S)-binding protein [Deltaproteobacteria bacterium]